jgi:predicted nucleotidyltransferase
MTLDNELLKCLEGRQLGYATFGGLRAYGTNRPDSDIDIRGFFMKDQNVFTG